MDRISIYPALLIGICGRSGFDPAEAGHRFAVSAWQTRRKAQTLEQLEPFATATRTPFGCIFPNEPPVERTPIPDLRTIGNAQVRRLSSNLPDTVYLCQHGEARDRDFTRSTGGKPVAFVGSAKNGDDLVQIPAPVALALAHGYVDVTHDEPANSTKKNNIPNACIGFGIKCMPPYQMLRQERARFPHGANP